MKISFLFLIAAVAVSSCASNKYVIDKKGVDMAQYQQDLEECKEYRDEVGSGARTAKSAAAGAVIGGVIGAILGNSDTAATAAGVGAVQGGAGSALEGDREKDQVVKNCLRGRGYRVLN